MTDLQWVPGQHHALARPGVVVLLSDAVSRADVLAIWDRLEDEGAAEGIGGLLDIFADVTGLGLRSLPDFAAVVLDESGVHVAVRGSFDVTAVHLDETTDTLRGREVSTWVERNFTTGTLGEVLLGSAHDSDAELPVVAGVLPAASLRLTLVAAAGSLQPRVRNEPVAAVPPVQPGGSASLLVSPVVPPAHDAPEHPAPAEAPAPGPRPAVTFISGVPSRGAAAVPVPVRAPGIGGAVAVQVDDVEYHDGHTALAAPDSTVLRAYVARSAASATDLTVLGVSCPAGHGNPTHRTECRVCAQPLSTESVRMPRPGLGWLHTSAGESIELLQNVLVGRDPRASRIQGPVMPRLLPLPHGHISGTHLEIRLEGWSVLLADLRSTNGTFLQRAGQPTLRIAEAPQLLMSGDIVQLGHGVDLRFEALP